jgi:glycosyltransferase involved in cell wall biosynthesis
MPANPKLSILIPAFNDANNIKKCLSQLIATDYADIEFVVVDDCSDDNTLEVLNTFSDPRLSVFNNLNRKGATATLLECLDKSIGEYVYFVGSDDYINYQYLETIIQNFDGENVITVGIHCFDDVSKNILDKQAFPNDIEKILGCGRTAETKGLMNAINHDELIHSFFPRKAFRGLERFSTHSGLSVFWFWCLVLFNNREVVKLDLPFLMKRYNHHLERECWNTIYKKNISSEALRRITESFFDLKSAVRVFRMTRRPELLFVLLFGPLMAQSRSGGFYGLQQTRSQYFRLGVLIHFILSPAIAVAHSILERSRKQNGM